MKGKTHGMVLLIVLAVVAFLALAGYAFVQQMLAYSEAAQLSGRQTQAWAFVQSGVASVLSLL